MSVYEAFALFQRGNFAGAEKILDTLLRKTPRDADALQLKAGIAHARGNLTAAIELFAQAARAAPDNASIIFNHASLLLEAERFAEAEIAFAAFLHRQPGDRAALMARASALAALKRSQNALADYDAAERAGEASGALYANRGAVHAGLQNYAEALADFERALAINPDDVKALYNRATALSAMDRYDEAITAFDVVLAREPQHAEAWNNRGTALMESGRAEAALESFARAIALKPNNVEFTFNPGLVHVACNEPAAAITHCDRALAINPEYGEALFTKAAMLLIQGEYERGWPLYEARWRAGKKPGRRVDAGAPIWLGDQDIVGKIVFVSTEQGFGDCFQFCRFARVLAERGARVILSERAPVLALMRSLTGVAEIISAEAPPPACDFHTPMASLPLALGVGVETAAPYASYLAAEPARIEAWRQRLGPAKRRRIGIAWAGAQHDVTARRRSLPLQALALLLEGDADWVSLQFDATGAEEALAKRSVAHFGEETADFAELAALIACCDAVISIDTGVAHLAGALGVETHVLLPFAPDWRWMLQRSDSPWYPKTRLHRQNARDIWDDPIASVRAALHV